MSINIFKKLNKITFLNDKFLVIIIIFLILFATVLINYNYLATFAIKGDDFSLVLNSASFFEIKPIEWFTIGYKYYFSNYPETFSSFSNFIRPTINISIFVESLLTKSPNSIVLLLTNYLGYSVCCVLVYLFSRYILNLNKLFSVLATLLFIGTQSNSNIFTYISFRGDMLGGLFSMLAFLLVYKYERSNNYFYLLLAMGSLLFAVFSKETAIVTPFVIIAWLMINKLEAKTFNEVLIKLNNSLKTYYKEIIVLLIPVIIYFIVFLYPENSTVEVGAYPLIALRNKFLGIPVIFINPLRSLIQMFFPFTSSEFLKQIVFFDYSLTLSFVRDTFALLLNIVSLLLIIFLTFKGNRSILKYFILVLVAVGVSMILIPQARFMFFSQMLALPLFVLILVEAHKSLKDTFSWWQILFKILIVFALIINPVFNTYTQYLSSNASVSGNYRSQKFQKILAEKLKDTRIKKIYYFNDKIGYYGALSTLKLVTTINNRSDIDLRVINSLTETMDKTNDEKDNVKINANNTAIELLVSIHKPQEFAFYGANDLTKLGINNEINYKMDVKEILTKSGNKKHIPGNTLNVKIPLKKNSPVLLIGFDPVQEGLHIYNTANYNYEYILFSE